MKRKRWSRQIFICLLLIILTYSFFFTFFTYKTRAAVEITDTLNMDVTVTIDSAEDYRYNVPFDNNSYFTVISNTGDWVLSVRSATTTFVGTIDTDQVLKCRAIPGDYNSTGWRFINGQTDTIIATGSATTTTGSQVNVVYEINWLEHNLQDQGWDDLTNGQHSVNLIYTLTTK